MMICAGLCGGMLESWVELGMIPNLEIDLPGHRKYCGCNDCYWYRRGIITPNAKKILGDNMPDLQIETDDDMCWWSAIKEAADALQAKCGKASTIRLDGLKVTLTIPPEVKEITARTGLTHGEMIEYIIRSDWGKNTAHGMCQKLLGVEPGTPEFNACFQRVVRKLAEGIFKSTTPL